MQNLLHDIKEYFDRFSYILYYLSSYIHVYLSCYSFLFAVRRRHFLYICKFVTISMSYLNPFLENKWMKSNKSVHSHGLSLTFSKSYYSSSLGKHGIIYFIVYNNTLLICNSGRIGNYSTNSYCQFFYRYTIQAGYLK